MDAFAAREPRGACLGAAEAQVDRVFERWTSSTPGCAVGVAVAGKPVLAKAYGMADLEHDVPNTAETLFAWIRETAEAAAQRAGAKVNLAIVSQSVPFYTEPGPFTDLVAAAAKESFRFAPALATTGGTSDARYIKDHCPVVELGLRNETVHMIDEHCAVEDVRTLARCYEALLRHYFSHAW